jgi:hypothetical protein
MQDVRVEIRAVDPRDITTFQESPVYRVTFYSRPEGSPGVPVHLIGLVVEDYDLVGVRDVHEALTWAKVTAGDRAYRIGIITTCGEERVCIELAGIDLTTGVTHSPRD